MPLDRGAKRDRVSSPPWKLGLSVDEGDRIGLDGDYWRGLRAGGLPTMTLTRIAIAPFAGK